MVVGGLYLLGVELLLAERIYLRSIIVGAMLVAAGGYFLWTDFIALKGNG